MATFPLPLADLFGHWGSYVVYAVIGIAFADPRIPNTNITGNSIIKIFFISFLRLFATCYLSSFNRQRHALSTL